MEKLLATIITIVIIFYLIKFIFRLVMPFLLKYILNKKLGNMFEQFNNYHDTSSYDHADYNQDEEIIIQRPNKKSEKKKPDPDEGEYVDFEEVK